MNIKSTMVVGFVAGSLAVCLAAYAEDRGRRPPQAAFVPHAPGPHPGGGGLHPHPVRSLAPRAVFHGHTGWPHWTHPDFARPAYYWDWPNVHTVTCTAEDSYGDQYPVSEPAPPGFGIANMTDAEDDALDRCYAESGQDTTCYLAACTHI
jgi:hypothetical protein